ncbi:MAG: MoaD/ThiS family protein [Acidimicrobiales bacterium]
MVSAIAPHSDHDPAVADEPRGAPARVVLRLFAAARQTAGTGKAAVEGGTVSSVLGAARRRYGEEFGLVVDGSRIWLNGEPAWGAEELRDGDEVAVLPPVSGGACR